MNVSRILLSMLALFAGLNAAEAQIPGPAGRGPSVRWTSEVRAGADGKPQIVLTGTPSGPFDEVHGTLSWIYCYGNQCGSPEEWDYAVSKPAGVFSGKPAENASSKASPAGSGSSSLQAGTVPEGASPSLKKAPEGTVPAGGANLWLLVLEAILWGFAMLLTPCVFPMVPMTVSFFLKRAGNKRRGRFNAAMYGLFIILLYTVPISLIIGLTWVLGGSAVTADIFNWLATHWLPNLLFFAVFMIFAASFFGAFELTMPSSLVNKSDRNSEKGGLGGIFFMALTLVLVSFSCTGPIVGTVLIKSTSGEFWVPMVTMLAFSLAFALPFTLLAFFPSLLGNLPKSGGWLNSVKVVLGFIELALGLKFLSTADQVYHWGILPREVYLAIWIVCFTLLGFYLLGKLRFKYDEKLEYISLGRLILAIADFTFVLWLLPGLWGAPLKALSGYLPPLESQTFVLGAAPAAVPGAQEPTDATLALPHGLQGYASIDEGLAAAQKEGKRVFVDITGYGCVNCREMEARVWSDPEVLRRLRDEFVLVALPVDDKTRLPESEWQVSETGRTLKQVGQVNSYLVRTRYGVNSQPYYLILSSDGTVLAGPRGYDLSVPGFIEFLDSERGN